MDLKIDKQNGKVAFNEEVHRYWNVDDNAKYISVTTLIETFGQPFDKDFWSAYKALERLLTPDQWKLEKKSLLDSKRFNKKILEEYSISENDFLSTQQDILDEWEENNRVACERGTKIHAEFEHAMYDAGANASLKKFGIGGKFTCDKGRNTLDLENGVYPEYLISRTSPDGILRLAGQIDLLVKRGNEIIIIDYKGLPLDTEIPTPTGWTTMGELKEGDKVFDKNGEITKVLHKSEIHLNPCYKINFDNGDSIVADEEHRWEISFKKNISKKNPTGFTNTIMTTKEIFNYLNNLEERRSDLIPKILNPSPLNTSEVDLLIDPYLLGVWLGDGSKDYGVITQCADSPLWDELKRRGFEISNNLQHSSDREGTEMRTIYGLRTLLRQLGVLNNKHIPNIYQRASYKQRLDLLRGFMDTDGYYHEKRKRYVMATGQEWQKDAMVKLLSTFGIKSTVFEVDKKCGDKKFKGWDVCFSTDLFNPFLIRNQNININSAQCNKRSFRNIISVEKVETVPTQCIEVDSPTHTYLCTEKMIVTHNTNKKLDLKSGFDTKSRSTVKMKYPLNNLDDCNFMHYTMQLSTYAWMIEQLNPKYKVIDLIILHRDHNDLETIYHLDYKKDEVIKMLKFYKKKLLQELQQARLKPIVY